MVLYLVQYSKMIELTDKQAECLRFIDKCVFPPTISFIQIGLGHKHRSAAQYLVDVLISKGAITHKPFVPRSIRVTAAGREWLEANREVV